MYSVSDAAVAWFGYGMVILLLRKHNTSF